MANVTVIDHSGECKAALLEAVRNALEKCGMTCESYAKADCPVDTGALRNSITHEVVDGERTVYIGTNLEYAPYVELGTGQYASGGRTGSWVYQDSRGEWHRTSGSRPQPYLKPALENHKDEYRAILSQALNE